MTVDGQSAAYMSLLHLWDIRGKALIAMDEFHGQGYLLPALEIAVREISMSTSAKRRVNRSCLSYHSKEKWPTATNPQQV